MSAFPWLLRLSMGARSLWTAPGVLAGFGLGLFLLERWRRRRRPQAPSQLPLALLVVAPLLMLLLAAADFGVDHWSEPGQWSVADVVIYGLAALHLVICGWVVVRVRKWALFGIPLTAFSLLWTAVTLFVSLMALANDWV